jgi:RNA polymerase sigma factor (sigma-70 family)
VLRLRSDDQLVALFRMGYDDAFRTIHDRYRQRLFAYTRQMLGGSRSDAEDVLQDVFLRAYRALRDDERPVTLRAWLYRVAHNRCIDHLRRPIPPAAEVYQLSRTPLRDPLDETERREDLRQLVEDVRRLPEHQRSALLMRELEGLSYTEMSDVLRTTVPAVKSLLVRARIGLVQAGEARDTACAEIREDLAMAHRRGVRASGRSRRHLRDCDGCRSYRQAMRTVHDGFAALAPGGGGPLATLAKLLGLGGASSGAAASAGVGAGGSVAAVGGASAATASKVVAIVCCAAVVGGGAAEVHQMASAPARQRPSAHAAPSAPAAARVLTPARRAADPLAATAPAASHPRRVDAPAHTKPTGPASDTATGGQATAPGIADPAPTAAEAQTGGALAPDEGLPDASATTDTAVPPADTGATSAQPVTSAPATGANATGSASSGPDAPTRPPAAPAGTG